MAIVSGRGDGSSRPPGGFFCVFETCLVFFNDNILIKDDANERYYWIASCSAYCMPKARDG